MGPAPALPACLRNARFALWQAARAADAETSDAIRGRHLLRGLLAADRSAVTRALLEKGLREVPPDPRGASIAGYPPDAVGGADLLGITADVSALSSVIAAKRVVPPLSIGLFGEWGSGKSFFMQKLREQISELTAKARAAPKTDETPYCAKIVQLEFNAWHYVDTSLWASLADEIFEKLALEVVRSERPPDQQEEIDYERAQLTTRVALTRQELARAEQEQAKIASRLRVVEAAAASERQEAEAVAAGLRPKAILQGTANVVVRQPEVKERLKEIQEQIVPRLNDVATALNVSPETLAQKAVSQGLLGPGGVGETVSMALKERRRPWWLLATVVFVAVALGAWWFQAWIAASLGGMVSSVVGIASLVGGLVAGAAAFGPAIALATRAIKVMRDIRTESVRLAEQESLGRIADIEKQRSSVQTELDNASEKVDKEREALTNLDDAIVKLRPDRKVTDFVKGRHASAEYARFRGVIGQAREDFEQLSLLLRGSARAPARKPPKRGRRCERRRGRHGATVAGIRPHRAVRRRP